MISVLLARRVANSLELPDTGAVAKSLDEADCKHSPQARGKWMDQGSFRG